MASRWLTYSKYTTTGVPRGFMGIAPKITTGWGFADFIKCVTSMGPTKNLIRLCFTSYWFQLRVSADFIPARLVRIPLAREWLLVSLGEVSLDCVALRHCVWGACIA